MSWQKTAVVSAVTVVGLLFFGVQGLLGFAVASGAGWVQYTDAPFPQLQASTDPAIIAQGEYIVHGPGHCTQCHTTTDRAHPEDVTDTPLHGGMSFEIGPLGTMYASNLTSDAETGIGNVSDEHLARALRTGVQHNDDLAFFMRYSAARLSDEDIVAVISYLRTLDPVKNEVRHGRWHLLGKLVLTYALTLEPRGLEGPEHVPPADEPSVDRGRYLVEDAMFCVDCHTELDKGTMQLTGKKLGGGLPEPSEGEEHMEFVAPNLTDHPTGSVGKLSEDAFVARFKAGRTLLSSKMPWENFQLTTESDVRSVYRYLKTVPPVDADRGPSYRNVGWTPQ